MNKTKKILEFPEYKVEGPITYFAADGYGIYLDRVFPLPETYEFYNLRSANMALNKRLNDSVLGIVYNKVKEIEAEKFLKDEKNLYRGKGDTIFVDTYDERWIKILQKSSLSKDFFKNKKNISRNNIDYVVYDSYIDKVYNKNMFSIIIPTYDTNDDIEYLRGIWYFDFNEKFFEKELKKTKAKLGLNLAVVDSKNEVVGSTEKDFNFTEATLKDYYSYKLGKTSYRILVEKIGIENLLGYEEFIFIIFLISLKMYEYKKEKLQIEVEKLKVTEKIRNHLLVRDSLTKMYNRYFIEKSLGYPLQNCGVVLIDIDYFKSINDNYGHDKGDHVLRAVSNIIKLLGGKNIHGIRWGGEEFLVLFKDIDRYKLLRKLEMIQVSVKKLRIVEDRVVTVSIGALIDDIDSKEALYKAVSESDKNLYKAKNSGRDRIVI
ncbi:MAG: diguanylate cyclase [Cetobacterium sp.]